SECFDMTAGFMTEDDRLADLHGPEAALLVIVEVGAANAPDRHFQANLAEAGLCHLPDFHLEVPAAVQPCLTRFDHFTCYLMRPICFGSQRLISGMKVISPSASTSGTNHGRIASNVFSKDS